MDNVQTLLCKCKAGRCHVCSACRRCGCDHDGVAVAKKVARRPGQHGPPKRREKLKEKRKTNNYKMGDLFESPLDPKKPERGKYSLKLPHTRPLTTITVIKRPADLFKAFNKQRELSHWYAHIPPIEQRSDPEFWASTSDAKTSAVLKYVGDFAVLMCTAMCGNVKEAGLALWKQFLLANKRDVGDSDELVQTIAECYAVAKKSSVEKRVLQASVCAMKRSLTWSKLSDSIDLKMATKTFASGRRDLESLKCGAPLVRAPRRIQRCSLRDIDYVVQGILRPDHVSFLSWGVRHIRLDDIRLTMPTIMRRCTRAAMYETYIHESSLERPESPVLSQASFYKIVSAITSGDARMQRAVDYVVGFLVNDAVDMLKQSIRVLDESVQRALVLEMDYNAVYLKYGFDVRVRDPTTSACILHNVDFGLSPVAKNQHISSMCGDCASVFMFYNRVKDMLVSAGAKSSTLAVVDDVAEKARLYVAHRLRVINQQNAIEQLMSDMRERCVRQGWSDEAHVVIDFKMKLEPMYYREKTVDHYGKRGMSWHGALVQYFALIDEQNHRDAAAQRVYFDHISKSDSKQDREAVLSMLEVIILRLKQDLPHIKCITLQSDNAAAYQNMLIPLVLPLLSVRHGIRITRFIHTETQDGKTLLDAHFARSMQLLKSWVEEGNNCITPTQAVVGLKSRGGLPNCVVELVEHDRAALALLCDETHTIDKKVRQRVKRANDIHIAVSNWDRQDSYSNYKDCPRFELTVYEYANFHSLNIAIDPATGMVHFDATNSDIVGVDDHDDQVERTIEENAINGHCDNVRSEDILDAIGDVGDDVGEDENVSVVADNEDTIDPSVSNGPVTGVKIATQGQIRRRTRRWRRRTENDAVLDHGSNLDERRDVLSCAIRRTIDLQVQGTVKFRDPRDPLSDVGGFVNADTIMEKVQAGWAVRPKRGSMYGKRNIAEFREDILEMYLRGVQNKAHKRGPGQMLEELRARYPHRVDLPTENEIRQEISKTRSQQQRQPSTTSTTTDVVFTSTCENLKVDPQQYQQPLETPSATGHPSSSRAINSFFDMLVDSNPSIKPLEGLKRFRDHYGVGILSDQQIKSKLSNTKTKRRKFSKIIGDV